MDGDMMHGRAYRKPTPLSLRVLASAIVVTLVAVPDRATAAELPKQFDAVKEPDCVGPVESIDEVDVAKVREATKEKEVARRREVSPSNWKTVCATPRGYVPQGLASRDGRLYLSAHAHDTKSAVFELDDQQKEFVKLFDLPADATHTSGIDFHAKEKDRLFVVDYNSDRVYLVDFAESKRVGKAVVLAAIDSQLRGTSACCLVDLPGEEERLMVTDFGTSGRNVFFTFDLKQNRMKLDSERSYSNYGWSQGATQHGGYVYETGNSLLSSYIVQHRLEDALSNGRITPVRKRSGPTRMIEGIVFLQDTVYVADEGTNLLYHSGWPSASSK